MRAESEPERLHDVPLTVQAKAAGLYVLVALMLLVPLTLVALPAETPDDRWIRIGSLMAAAGLAVWLPLRALLPAVLLVWAMPMLARELLDEGRNVGGTEAAVLGGLVLLALSVHYSHTATLRLLSGQAHPLTHSSPDHVPIQPYAPPDKSSQDNHSGTLEARCRPDSAKRRRWASSPSLSEADAAYFLRKLRALDAEVLRTAGSLHLAPETSE
jgi:hypothetical protein